MKGEKQTLKQYVDELQCNGHYVFLRAQAINEAGLSREGFKKAARRLIEKKRIQRVRGEFFIIVPLEYASVGSPPASWFIDKFMRYQPADYYVGIMTAAASYGASHQQSMTFQVITNKQMRPIKLGNVLIRFYFSKHSAKTPTKTFKTETGQMQVSTPEATAYDIVRFMSAAGHIHNVGTMLIELSDQLSFTDLMAYVLKCPIELAVLQRLGYLLDTLELGVPLQELAVYIRKKSAKFCWLVPKSQGLDSLIEKNEKWRVLVNEKVEPDV